MAVNKVVYNGSTLIDLESDTAVASDVAKGKTFHLATGVVATGTATGTGDPNLKQGEVSLTTSSSTTSIKITDTSEIGFTPKAFFLICDVNKTTRYMVSLSYFVTMGSNYKRHTVYRGSSADSYINSATNWTTQTSGYLYFNSNTVYFRNYSSYRIATATYRWIAVTW